MGITGPKRPKWEPVKGGPLSEGAFRSKLLGYIEDNIKYELGKKGTIRRHVDRENYRFVEPKGEEPFYEKRYKRERGPSEIKRGERDTYFNRFRRIDELRVLERKLNDGANYAGVTKQIELLSKNEQLHGKTLGTEMASILKDMKDPKKVTTLAAIERQAKTVKNIEDAKALNYTEVRAGFGDFRSDSSNLLTESTRNKFFETMLTEAGEATANLEIFTAKDLGDESPNVDARAGIAQINTLFKESIAQHRGEVSLSELFEVAKTGAEKTLDEEVIKDPTKIGQSDAIVFPQYIEKIQSAIQENEAKNELIDKMEAVVEDRLQEIDKGGDTLQDKSAMKLTLTRFKMKALKEIKDYKSSLTNGETKDDNFAELIEKLESAASTSQKGYSKSNEPTAAGKESFEKHVEGIKGSLSDIPAPGAAASPLRMLRT